ncbi:surfeit locus protein 1 isoform X2 [Nomia melanderi]|uniref:surfeit locus protein 1 isoform X2 n=1 Tax=Nomia melanderi TaxID=2448451 RepID=UPI0013044B11|nr:surfeit locus protein 1 isoform X2 [Nomia melanderi]
MQCKIFISYHDNKMSIPIGTFLLGVWQIQRRKWKLGLIQDLNERTTHEPVELPADLEQLKLMEYYPIKVKGTFLYDKEFVQGLRNLILDGEAKTDNSFMTSQNSKKGYWIITPFKLSDRDLTILVNRGWIPKSFKSPAKRQNIELHGEVEITGILRLNEPRPQFVPKNSPDADDLWYYRDVNAMAEKAETAPIYIEMTRNKDSHTYPIGGQTQVVLRNEHLSYIITWFSLSAATSYMWYKQVLKRCAI